MKFVIPGEPTGKGRPRVVNIGGHARAFTPEKTASYENLIKLEFERQGGRHLGKAEIMMRIRAFYAIPKGDSRVKREAKLAGSVRPVKKPDCDNVIKIVADALNGLAYDDDCQIVAVSCEKWFGEEPRVEVEIGIAD